MTVVPRGQYEYRVILRHRGYFRALVNRRIGGVIGLTTYPDRFIIQFDRVLTDVEKAELDSLVAENPVPAAIYEVSPITEGDIETEIGVRPIVCSIDPLTGRAICFFDTTLTPEQESLLEASLRVPMRFKRRKP